MSDETRVPEWLYLKRESKYDTIWRFGSRRPLRVVWTTIKDKPPPGARGMATTHLFAIGRLHLSYGSADGITEGLVPGMRWRLLERRNGMGLLIAWGRG